jgi:hypothetical protein
MRDDFEIAQIEKQYNGQWLVVEITKTDKHNNPLRGCVLFHGTDQDEVYGQGAKYRKEHVEADLFYFYAGDMIPPGFGIMPIFGTTPAGEVMKIGFNLVQLVPDSQPEIEDNANAQRS